MLDGELGYFSYSDEHLRASSKIIVSKAIIPRGILLPWNHSTELSRHQHISPYPPYPPPNNTLVVANHARTSDDEVHRVPLETQERPATIEWVHLKLVSHPSLPPSLLTA